MPMLLKSATSSIFSTKAAGRSLTNRSISAREKSFCYHYVADPERNGTQAAKKAGYSPATAGSQANRLLKRAHVLEEIHSLEREGEVAAAINFEQVVRRFSDIVRADPSTLCAIEVGACRFCHGKGHEYQWRTQGEFQRRCEDWNSLSDKRKAQVPEPTDEGGYGYSHNLAPNPVCPECDGRGTPEAVLHASSGHPLYAGHKVNQHGGIEIKLKDQVQALENVARIVGAYERDNAQLRPGESFGDLLVSIIKDNKAQGAVLNRGDGGDDNA